VISGSKKHHLQTLERHWAPQGQSGNEHPALGPNGSYWHKAVIYRPVHAVACGAAALQLKGDLSGVVGLIIVRKSGDRHAQQPYGVL
jgi:hypothetical protein